MSRSVSCPHASVRTVATRGYGGSVASSADEENRAAHGNICDEQECRSCGARRKVNINGRHVEHGPWGPSLEERRETLRIARARVPASPPAIEVVHSDGRRVGVSVDHEGMIVIVPGVGRADEDRILRALPPAWLAAATATRRGVLAVSAAESEVES